MLNISDKNYALKIPVLKFVRPGLNKSSRL